MLFLLALQKIADSPFRIVDEINQGTSEGGGTLKRVVWYFEECGVVL